MKKSRDIKINKYSIFVTIEFAVGLMSLAIGLFYTAPEESIMRVILGVGGYETIMSLLSAIILCSAVWLAVKFEDKIFVQNEEN